MAQSGKPSMVPPGNQTGVYYIPFSGCRFDATWQQIKDFVRQVADVDHVRVFPESTSGWVKVTGKHNFEKALAKLNGGDLNGKALIAKGDNATQAIFIRDLNLPHEGMGFAASSGSGQGGPTTPPFGPLSSTYASTTPGMTSPSLGAPTSAFGSPTYSTPVSHYMSPTIAYSPGYSKWGNCPSDWTQPASASEYDWPVAVSSYDVPLCSAPVNHMPSWQGYGHPQPYGCVPQLPAGYGYAVTTSSQSQSAETYSDYYYPQESAAAWPDPAGDVAPSPGSFVSTEKRKLLVKDISFKASEGDIKKLIREAAGADAESIQDIDLPKDAGGALKYTALVLFATPEAARAVQRKLHRKSFKGRDLTVRFTTEGASAAESSARGGSVSGSRHHPHGKNKDSKDREKDKDRSKHGLSSRPGPQPCRDKKDRGKDRDDDRDRDRGRDEQQKKGVVIAHGSSKQPVSR